MKTTSAARYIRWFEEIRIEDIPEVGGKNASIGEMYRELQNTGIKVPNGFAITADAYWHMLQAVGAVDALKNIMKGLDTSNVEDLSIRGRKARDIILEAGIPDDLWTEIKAAYDRLCEEYGPDTDVAVRSSATAEDLPTASFAGQQETYLNVHGYPALKIACTLFCLPFHGQGNIIPRHTQLRSLQSRLSIGVMKMVRSDLASSGVIFTIDTESGFKDVVFITGAYGLGENVVQGAVNPDEFYVFKPTLKAGYKPIIQKKLGSKDIKMIYGVGDSKIQTRNVDVPESDRRRYCINNEEILTLAKYAVTIEDYYSNKSGKPVPMDIEWPRMA
jgi:pyruvate,water dikinase